MYFFKPTFLTLFLLLIGSILCAQTFTKIYSQSPHPINLEFGKSDIALSNGLLIVGSENDSSAYLYDLQSGNQLVKHFRKQDYTYAHPNPTSYSRVTYKRFGHMIDLTQDRLVIGYFYDADSTYPNSGQNCTSGNYGHGAGAQIFEYTGPFQWSQVAHQDGDLFSANAEHVDLSGNKILVSGENADSYWPCNDPFAQFLGHRTGQVTLFERMPGAPFTLTTWTGDATYITPFYQSLGHIYRADAYGCMSSSGNICAMYVAEPTDVRLTTFDMGANQTVSHVNCASTSSNCTIFSQIGACSDTYAYVWTNYGLYSSSSREIWKWDTQQQQWVYDAPLPVAPHAPYFEDPKNILFIGDQLYMGDTTYNQGRGCVKIYQKDPLTGSWRATFTYSPSSLQTGDHFGATIDIEGDLMAVGAPGDDTQDINGGAIYLFQGTCSLPQGLFISDIGNHGGVSSSVCFDALTHEFDIHASGHDIYSTIDGFTYLYQPLSGDGEVEVRIKMMDGNPFWNLVGVMIRETLDPQSPNAFVGFNGGAGNPQSTFQQRSYHGGLTSGTMGSQSNFPNWVRLSRIGDDFFAYESTDGENWNSLGTAHIPMEYEIYIGMAVASPIPGHISYFNPSHLTINGYTFKQTPNISFEEVEMVENYRSVSSNLESVNPWKVYPTLAKQSLNIKDMPEGAKLSIVNSLGQVVRRPLIPSRRQSTLDITDLKEGIYFLQVQIGEKVTSQKFVKVN